MQTSDQTVREQAGKLATSTAALSQMCILSVNPKSKFDAVYIAALGAIGALQVLASLTGSFTDKSNPAESINPVSTLFAALLAVKIAPAGTAPDGTTHAEFNPHVVFEALEATEKLIGRKPDEYLDENMCLHTRKIAAEGNAPLVNFLAARNRTIN